MTKPVKAVTFTDVMDMVDGTADIDCSNRGLTSLEGCPEKVKGYFNCSGNKLTTLGGAPKKIKGDFNCSCNLLTTLEGGPEEVDDA